MFANYILPFCLFSFYVICTNYGIKIFKAQWNHRDQKSTDTMLNFYLFLTQGILSAMMIGFGILWQPKNGSATMGPGSDVLCWLLIGTGLLLIGLSMMEFFLMLSSQGKIEEPEQIEPELELSPEEEEAAAEAAEA